MAAAEFSFDIVSRVDAMEVKNAIGQAQKDLSNRYDLKGTKCEIELVKDDVTLVADDEFRMDQLKDIVISKLIKRGVDSRQFEWASLSRGPVFRSAASSRLKNGIAQDKSKPLIKQLKDAGLKVQAQIQGDEIRVSSKSKDDLQKAIQFIKGLPLDFPVDCVNFR